LTFFLITKNLHLKFGDGDEPNLCRVKNVSSTFIENLFRCGLTLVSSYDIITIKVDKKKFKKFCKKSQENKQTKKIIQNKNLGCQMDIRETNSDYETEKDNLQIFAFKKMLQFSNFQFFQNLTAPLLQSWRSANKIHFWSICMSLCFRMTP